MARQLNKAQVNHLRLLLGWVRCEIWQSPEEIVATTTEIIAKLGLHDLDDGAKQRCVESYEKASRVPKYVRAAVKALTPVVREIDGEIVDAEIPAPQLESAVHGPRKLGKP